MFEYNLSTSSRNTGVSSITLREEIVQNNNKLSKNAEIQQNESNYGNRENEVRNKKNNAETEQTESAGSMLGIIGITVYIHANYS